jgi:hypothetical protein
MLPLNDPASMPKEECHIARPHAFRQRLSFWNLLRVFILVMEAGCGISLGS